MRTLLRSLMSANQQRGNIMANMGAVFTLDARDSVPGEQWVLNRGSAGQVLRAKYGSVARAEVRNGVGLVLPGSGANGATTAAIDSSWGTSFEIIVRSEHGTWRPTVNLGLTAHASAGTNASRSVLAYLQTNGTIRVGVSDGTNIAWPGAATALPAGNAVYWLRIRGSWAAGLVHAEFEYADDQGDVPTSWIDLGSDDVALAGPPNPASLPFVAGALYSSSLSSNQWDNVIKRVIWKNGAGSTVLDVDFTTQPDLASSFTCSTGQTVTVTEVNAVDTNDPLLLPWTGVNYIYFPGVAGNTVTTPAVAYNLTGDVEIIVETRGIDWSAAGRATLVGSWNGGFLFDKLNTTRLLIGSVLSSTNNYSQPLHGLTGVVDQWFRVRYEKASGTWFTAKSPDGVNWTDITASTFAASPGDDFPNFTNPVTVGGFVSTGFVNGRVPVAEMRNGYGGPAVFRYDEAEITDWTNLSSWVASTGETWTINRSATGRKTALVTRPMWLFGTDDYFEIADNDLLDFGENQDFTIIGVARSHGLGSGNQRLLSKRQTTGYVISRQTAGNWETVLNDGAWKGPAALPYTAGDLAVIAGSVSQTTATKITGFVNAFYWESTADPGDLSNSIPLRVGAEGGSSTSFADMELLAVGIFRRALSNAEVDRIVQFYNGSYENTLQKLGAVFAAYAKDSKVGEQWVLNRGSGGQALRAKYGSVSRAEIRNGVGLVLPGTSSADYAQSPSLTMGTGSVELVARVILDDYTAPGGLRQQLVGRGASSSTSSYLSITTNGYVGIVWSNGTNVFTPQSDVLPPFVDGTGYWIKGIRNQSDGVCRFYYANDQESEPSNWIKIGSDVVSEPGVAITQGTSVVEFGSRNNGASNYCAGVIKRGIIRNGPGGMTLLDADFTAQPDLTTSFTCSTGQTVTVTAANAVDTNDPLLLPWSGENYVYLPGEIGNQIRIQHSNQISSATTIEYVVRAVFSQPATERHIVGSSSTHWRANLTTSGALRITVLRQGDLATIGNVASGDIPGIFNGNPIWVRARLTPATSVCEYWYSFAATNNRSEVSWTALTGGVGVNVGVPWFTTTGTTMIGTSSTGASGVPGRYLYGALLIDGDVRAEVDLTKQTISAVGQAVTSTNIDRSASGRKTTIVSRPVWLFGTDDYMEIADNDLLDFTASDDFSIVTVTRDWDTSVTLSPHIAKKATPYSPASDVGWHMGRNMANISVSASDGTTLVEDNQSYTPGVINVSVAVRSAAGNTIQVYSHGISSVVTGDGSSGSFANSLPVRIGNVSTAYHNGEIFAIGIFRKALTTNEIAVIMREFTDVWNDAYTWNDLEIWSE